MRAINPATGQLLREYPDHDRAEVTKRLAAAESAFPGWSHLPCSRRAAFLSSAAKVLRDEAARWATTMTLEMGKPIAAAEAEVEKCAWVCDFYAENAEALLAPEPVQTDASESFVRFDPLGPLLAVMPWNFPLWQVFRFAAPALVAGNVGLLKHASNVPGCALAIEEIFRLAGLPGGVFATLLVGSGAVDALVQHPAIRAVSLTGSDAAGRSIGRAAAAALKKTVLELGGSDPFVVLADADVAAAAAAGARARCVNNGQSCIAAKRFIVEAPVAEAFEAALVQQMRALKVGDPMDRGTDIGPLARADLRDELHSQVERTVRAGARLLLGGEPLPGAGWFYAPTVLSRVRPGMAAFDEETFGPVATLSVARDADEAIALANATCYGLGASLWTQSAARGRALARELDAGSVFINGPVKSDPRLPFGGIKASGHGRELAQFGIREFVNVKTVWAR